MTFTPSFRYRRLQPGDLSCQSAGQSCHPEAVEFVAARRRETRDDTEHMLRLLGHVTEDTPAALTCWLGWLLNAGRLVTMDPADIERQRHAPQLQVRRAAAAQQAGWRWERPAGGGLYRQAADCCVGRQPALTAVSAGRRL